MVWESGWAALLGPKRAGDLSVHWRLEIRQQEVEVGTAEVDVVVREGQHSHSRSVGEEGVPGELAHGRAEVDGVRSRSRQLGCLRWRWLALSSAPIACWSPGRRLAHISTRIT